MQFDNLTPAEMLTQLKQQAQKIQDLEAELKAERDISKSCRYQAQLLDFVLDPVISSDSDFNIVSWNRAAEQLYGWTEAEALGRNATELLGTEYTDDTTNAFAQQQFRKQGIWRGEMIHHRKDGTSIPIMGTTAMIFDENQETQGYVTVLRDMTEKVQAEQVLKESEERYRIISELMSDYAYLYRLDENNEWYRVWTTLEAFERITGYGRESVVDGTFGLYHPDEVERVEADIAKTLAGENTEGAYRIITRQGEQKWVYIYRRPLWDDSGERVVGFYGGGKEITQRKEQDEKLLAYRREEDQIQVLQRFIDNASHDLKTPLSTINTSIYLLNRYITDDKQKLQLIKLENHVNRLVALIEDMFDMSRLDLSQKLYQEQVNLSLYLPDIIKVYQSVADERNIQIINETESDDLQIYADMTSMQQAIGNIIENAIVFSPDGTVIHVKAYKTDDQIHIQIQDHGIGMSADEIDRIFERFYRVDKSRNTGSIASTGLGLAISKKVVELHNGTITVDSVVDEGTIFTIQLPSYQSNH